MTAARIARELGGKRSGTGFIAKCPAHDDSNPSLSLADGNGTILAHCHAGCSQEAVVDALKALGLWPDRGKPTTAPRIVAQYDYADEHGQLLYQIIRFEPKNFKQRYRDGAGGWIWKKHPNQVLFHLQEVLQNPIIFLAEGEKDVERMRDHGFVATTNAGGAKAPWLPQFTDALKGREVHIIPDNDAPGRQRAKVIATALLGHAARLFIWILNDAKDISDWFDKGHSELELIEMIEKEAYA